MKELVNSIQRTPYQSFASFLILFFTLLLVLFFFHLTSFFHGVLGYVETRPLIMAYFQTTADEKSILRIKNQIESTGKTASVVYVSQKEAYEFYKQYSKDDPILLAMVTPEILPASLEIRADDPHNLTVLSAMLKKETNIASIEYQKEDVDQLLAITNVMRQIAVGVFAVLLVISVIVLMTTTAFKIALKRDEIELMQLLGATKWYIRKPFLLEGIFFGILSGTIAYAVLFISIFVFQPSIQSRFLPGQTLEFYSLGRLGIHVWPLSVGYLAIAYLCVLFFGTVIGFVGNYIAASKYIK